MKTIKQYKELTKEDFKLVKNTKYNYNYYYLNNFNNINIASILESEDGSCDIMINTSLRSEIKNYYNFTLEQAIILINAKSRDYRALGNSISDNSRCLKA